MSKDILESLEILKREKNIDTEVLLEAIENSIMSACKSNFGTADNIKIIKNLEKGEYKIFQEKEIVEKVDKKNLEEKSLYISLEEARQIKPNYNLGDKILIPVKLENLSRISAANGKNVILQKIREEGKKSIFEKFRQKEKDIVTAVVQRRIGNSVAVNIDDYDAILAENEQVPGEILEPTQHIKVYLLEVKETTKGPKLTISRTHPDLVKRLFEKEVVEIKDGIVEIKAISREAGSRTKIAVSSISEKVDPVGACVGLNGNRVNMIVQELRGEKIDIINWSDNSAVLIENSLSPAKVICVVADDELKEAIVIVPDYQLSLAIGKEGQNARLAAKLTGYKIDIKSESQARQQGLFEELGIDYQSEGSVNLEETFYEDYKNILADMKKGKDDEQEVTS